MVTDQEGETLGLGGLGVGWAVELGGIGGVVEPDVGRSHKAHQAQGSEAIAQIGLAIPDEGAPNPTEGLSDDVPDATENTNQADPDVTTNDVLHGVHTDNPAFTTKRGAQQITEDHARAKGWIADQANVSTPRSPGVINTAEEHCLEDQQQGTNTKKDEVITDDVGHLVLIAPILGEEGGIVFQDFWATQGVIKTAQAKNGRTDQMQHPDHKEGVKAGDFTAWADPVAQRGNVGKQNQTLLIHGLVEGEMTHLEEHHGSSPKNHQTRMGDMGAKQTA